MKQHNIIKARCEECKKMYDIRYRDEIMPLSCFNCVDKFTREMYLLRGAMKVSGFERRKTKISEGKRIKAIDPKLIKEMQDFYLAERDRGSFKAKTDGAKLVLDKFRDRCDINTNITHSLLTKDRLLQRW